jgi:hypothetical protein
LSAITAALASPDEKISPGSRSSYGPLPTEIRRNDTHRPLAVNGSKKIVRIPLFLAPRRVSVTGPFPAFAANFASLFRPMLANSPRGIYATRGKLVRQKISPLFEIEFSTCGSIRNALSRCTRSHHGAE